MEGTSSVTIRGSSGHEKKTITCLKNVTILFSNVTNITLSHLEVYGCGAYDSINGYKAAVTFKVSSNIRLIDVTLRLSQSTAAAFLNCNESVLLEKSHFISNGHTLSKDDCLSFPRPAGASIVITDHKAVAIYTLTGCLFSGNEVLDNASEIYHQGRGLGGMGVGCGPSPSPSHSPEIYQQGRGLGGGMGIYISGNCSGNTVAITNTIFKQNKAGWGGGVYLLLQSFAQGNTISINNSEFHENKAFKAGGGAYVALMIDRTLQKHTNMIIFQNVTFSNCSAIYGGGIAIAAEFSDHIYLPGVNIAFKTCIWNSSNATYSPAVDIAPYFGRHLCKSGFLPIPVFSQVVLTGNAIIYPRDKLKVNYHVNSGVFSITLFTVFFTEMVEFTYNRYSALHLTSAIVFFEDKTSSLFRLNKGGNGAAIAMYDFSTIFVNANTYFEFTQNEAVEYGGGIYYQTSDQHDFLSASSCFIQYDGPKTEEKNVTFIFQNNTAGSGGRSIYANSFLSCFTLCGNTSFQCIGDFTFDKHGLESSGSSFVFHDDIENYELIPGASGSVSFSVNDELNQTVQPLIHLGKSSMGDSIKVTPQYSINNTKFKSTGRPNSTATLNFLTDGISGVFFRFKVTLLDCPPGFYFDNRTDLMSCVCSTNLELFSAIVRCNYTYYQAFMRKSYWAGYIPPTSTKWEDLFFAPCASPACKNIHNQLIPLPNTSNPDTLISAVCESNRAGVMCGKCMANTSVYYHSREYRCRENYLCALGPLFYILSEVFPVVCVFGVIVIFDISFTSGGVVGFIFFSQYLDRLTLHINPLISSLRKPYRMFYGIFNFEYFTLEPLAFCLWEGFQILDIIFFKYITILIAFMLVVGLAVLLQSNRCTKIFMWRSKITMKASFLKGLSAFLVICYNQCTRTSFLILKFTRPEGINGRIAGTYSYYGGLSYFQGKHLIYAIPAMLSLVFVTILPPLVLLLYPLSLQLLSLCGLSEHWIVNKTLQLTGINKLKPFIDCFQSCYKDRLRFFAGLYFVYRVAILCSFTLFETAFNYRISSEALLIMFLGLHSLLQPYKNRLHNFIDSLVFLNLALVNIISIFSSHLMDDEGSSKTSTPLMILTVVQLILVYLPMVVSLVVVTGRYWHYIKSRKDEHTRRGYEMLEE